MDREQYQCLKFSGFLSHRALSVHSYMQDIKTLKSLWSEDGMGHYCISSGLVVSHDSVTQCEVKPMFSLVFFCYCEVAF